MSENKNTDNKNAGQHDDIDPVTGTKTTGHEWDGLKELDTPMPRWWLWIFYITIIWSIGYWVAYPAWPTISGNTKGMLGWTQHKKLIEDQAEITARQGVYLEEFEKASFEKIMNDAQLYAFANAGGASAFKDNCATCHGSGGAGAPGYPNLNDDDWLWGGTINDIYQTILYGIRAKHEDTYVSTMPAFGKEGLLSKDDINMVVDHVLFISGQSETPSAQGHEIFKNQCASCHDEDGKGISEYGAPNLRDAIWLYGGSRAEIYKTTFNSRAGVMPAWEKRLDSNTIRQLSVYVHQLGGGEEITEKTQLPEPEMPPISVEAIEIIESEIIKDEPVIEQSDEPAGK